MGGLESCPDGLPDLQALLCNRKVLLRLLNPPLSVLRRLFLLGRLCGLNGFLGALPELLRLRNSAFYGLP